MFVGSWTSSSPSAPCCLPGGSHISMDTFSRHSAFSVLQGEYKSVIYCAENLKKFPHNRLAWPDNVASPGPNPLCTYVAPFYRCYTCPNDACSSTHNPPLQFLARSEDGAQRTECTQVRKIQLHVVQHLIRGPSSVFVDILLRMDIAESLALYIVQV